jgi:anti-sigma regulatory factor (Ser/Thr protein kinase)
VFAAEWSGNRSAVPPGIDQEQRMAQPPGGPSSSLELSFPADAYLVREVRRFVVNVCRLSGVVERKREELGLALTEILNNSVEHGANGGGRIRVGLTFQKDRIVIRVTDEGENKLDPARVRSAIQHGPGKPDDTQFRGRGLFLIHSLMDEFRVVPSEGPGTTLEMVKLR